MSGCHVNLLTFIMKVLILADISYIQRSVSYTAASTESTTQSAKTYKGKPVSISCKKDNLTFESSCEALIWSAAETDCINKGATIFTIQDLVESIGGQVLEKAKAEHTTLWLWNNGTTCKRAVNESFLEANCSDTNYYVCKGNTSTSSEWYVPCREGSTVTSTQATGSSGSSGSTAQNLSSTTQSPGSEVAVITVVTCGVLALTAVSIAFGCYFIQRKIRPGNHQDDVVGEGRAEENTYCHLEARTASETSNYATLRDAANIGRIPAIQLDD